MEFKVMRERYMKYLEGLTDLQFASLFAVNHLLTPSSGCVYSTINTTIMQGRHEVEESLKGAFRRNSPPNVSTTIFEEK